MEVYLNVAETGIGTYGVNAGAQRYFGHDAVDAEPQPRRRGSPPSCRCPSGAARSRPSGFTRRYGNTISARIGVVAREGLDACVYRGPAAPRDAARAEGARDAESEAAATGRPNGPARRGI